MTSPPDDTTTDTYAVIAALRAERDAGLAREAALAEELAARTAELTTRNSEFGERNNTLRQQAADTAGQTDRRLDQPTNAEKPRLRCQPARLKSSKRLVQPPFGLVLCDRSPTRHLTCVSWTGLRCARE